MAKYETEQDLLDAIEEFTELCQQVKKEKSIFVKMAENFQKIEAAIGDKYWKTDEETTKRLTANIRQLIENVKKVIAYETG